MSYIVPIGPYHPALVEPIHVKLYTEGEHINKADIFIGYNNRGIEKLICEKNFIQTITLIERLSGIDSHSNTLCYCLALESIAQMEIPKRASYIRVIIAELERLQSHLLWLGLMARVIGFESGFMSTLAAREKVMDILEMITGNRVNHSMNIIGGVRRDLSKEQVLNLLLMIEELKEPYKKILHMYSSDNIISIRTKEVGKLTYGSAWEYSVCGPHGRASGIDYDLRKDAPYCCYEDFNFEKIIQNNGDVFDRIMVRLLEIQESFKILTQAAENIPDTEVNLGIKMPEIPSGEICMRVESPRGETTNYVVTDGSCRNLRVNIHAPTFKNLPTVPLMLKENFVSDAGLIITSIDPSFSSLDR